MAACRLAKAAGASEVVGICSAGNASLVMGEGATRCVDYSDAAAMEALAAEGANFDVVYDAATGSGAGEDYVAYSARVRAKHGRTVAINGGLRKWLGALFGWQKANDKLILTKQSGKELDELVALLGGQPKPIIADHFPLSEDGVANAFKQLKSRRTRGKIIIDIA